MSNKTLTVQMRRLACTVLVFAFTIFLSGCSGKQIVGSINMSEEYASLGDVSITNGELWNELKWSANDYLTEVIEKGINCGINSRGRTEIWFNGKRAVIAPCYHGHKMIYMFTAFNNTKNKPPK